MMVISLLPVVGTLLKQLAITLLIPLSVSIALPGGETVAPRYRAWVTVSPSGMSVMSTRPANGYDVANSEIPDSPGSPGTGDTSKSSPRKVAKQISARIDSVMAQVELRMDADSILNVQIGPPVPDRTGDDAVETITTAISSINDDWDGERIENIVLLVTLIISVICFGLPFLTMIVIIGLILNSRMKYQRERLRVMENIVTSGHEVPAELTGDRNDPVERRKNFISAVKWIAVGMSLTLLFGLLTKSALAIATFGLIPAIVGLAKLAIFIYDQYLAPKDDGEDGGEPPVFPPRFSGLSQPREETAVPSSEKTEIDIEAYHARFMPKEEE